VGIDHPTDSSLTTFEDGTQIKCEADLKKGQNELEVRTEGLSRRVSQLQSVLDWISKGNDVMNDVEWEMEGKEKSLKVLVEIVKRIDCQNIGATGHSFGGATAIALAQEDERVKSVVALDPWLWPLSPRLSSSFSLPSCRVLMLSAENWEYGWKQRPFRLQVASSALHPSTSWIVKGTGHHNFNDMPLIARPWFGRRMKLIGSSDPVAVYRLISTCMIHFFSLTLPLDGTQNDSSPSLVDPSFLPPHLQRLVTLDETYPVPSS